MFRRPSSPPRNALARWVCVGALAFAPAIVRAATEEPHELEESTSTELDKLRPLIDAKNWGAAIDLIRGIQAKVGPDSYDNAFVSNILAKLFLQKGDYTKVVEPWETVLRLQETHHYLDDKDIQDILYFLAQIYGQEASNSKVPAVIQQNYSKAAELLKRWMANTKKPPTSNERQDAEIFYSSVLYNLAVANGEVNKPMLKQAEEEIQKGLRMTPRPKEGFYQLLLAISQQENNYPRLAELLEILVKQFPQKKDYWSQLENIYLNLAQQEAKNETLAREYNIRAIYTIERAQQLGFLKTPKDNYTLVGIYFNIGQFGRATELLHAGLRDGSIESEQKNWELLAYSYQQVDKPYEAIDVLTEGAKHFPRSGQLDYQAAQVYYSLNKAAEAYKALMVATTKGHLEKPASVYGFVGYVAWELGKLEEALEAVNKALSLPDSKKDEQLPKLKSAIQDALNQRAAQLASPNKR